MVSSITPARRKSTRKTATNPPSSSKKIHPPASDTFPIYTHSHHYQPYSYPYTYPIPPPPPQHVPSPPTSTAACPPPPPPASASAVVGNFLSGFQTDYPRVEPNRPLRRPRIIVDVQTQPTETSATESDICERDHSSEKIVVRKGVDLNGQDGQHCGEVRPPPPEAYMVIRPHRVPRAMWDDGVEGQVSTAEHWSYELQILQSPQRGKALGVQPLGRSHPPLSAPLIVQLLIRDYHSQILPLDNPNLSRRLVHMVMMVDLVSPDGSESRSLLRVKSHPDHVPPRYASFGSLPQVPPNVDREAKEYRNLLGSTFKPSTTLTLNGEKGAFFIFSELVVRNPGDFALKLKVLDIAGPPHVGTSIGVTKTLVETTTSPFTVYHHSNYPGSLPVTELSAELTRQGERNLGRRLRDSTVNGGGRGTSEEEE
ncbi:uncharacterized protein L203_101720 [Cryptococcus depauperatus CBS 7841]|uniref:Velvet domain-containing protein n=1 Tax=Cryptococcus depauperatus CBS 7841 TaxID=1295531 RepID=A0AAJ8JQG3_9TREE